MKRLHRTDLFAWSRFDEDRNIDFHSVLWICPAGNIAIDPLPLSAHDEAHLDELGGVEIIVVTNSDHVRDAAGIADRFNAGIYGPAGERESFPIECERWIGDDEIVVPGLEAKTMAGSKTPGELALILDGSTLITGDLIRAHEGGRLCLLPDAKLHDRSAAHESVRRIAAVHGIDAVLPGDGWPVFRDGKQRLAELVAELTGQ